MRAVGKGWLVAGAVLVALLSCNGNGKDPEPGDTDPSESWHTVTSELSGAVLSMWGNSSSDLWIAGSANADLSAGPIARHFDGTSWTDLQPPTSEHLWWVTGRGTDTLWFVGDNGIILEYDRATSSFQEITSPTNATFFGAWAADSGPTYVVGGFIDPEDDPVIVRVEAGVATLVTGLPTGILRSEAFFKVWGSAPDDVWVIGDEGTVLNYDGGQWIRRKLPGDPRLVTLHGSGVDDMVVVGGASKAIVFQSAGGVSWTDRSPPSQPPLNGIFVTAGGRAVAAGMLGVVLERVNNVWTTLPPVDLFKDWHAVWIDENDDAYVGGGNLLSLKEGAILRYGPDR